MEAQVEVSRWMGQVAGLLPFGYAFGAGMVSAVNPCGFAMLPVYLTLYLGAEDSEFRRKSFFLRVVKAFWIAFMVTAGFALLFGVVGAIVAAGGSFLMGIMPWLAVVVGVGLIFLGIWMLFGMAFGAISISCTLPIFLMVVGSSIAAGDFTGGLFQFVSYILGMGSVMLLLTLGITVVKEGVVVGTIRRIVPYVQKISALLLLVAGGYIVYYWLSSGLLFQ